MEPFVAALETYHDLTAPVDLAGGVVKAYVGHGMAADFYREVAKLADPATRELIDSVLVDAGRAEFAVREVHSAVAAQPSARTGWRCTPAAWSARRSARPSMCWPTGTR